MLLRPMEVDDRRWRAKDATDVEVLGHEPVRTEALVEQPGVRVRRPEGRKPGDGPNAYAHRALVFVRPTSGAALLGETAVVIVAHNSESTLWDGLTALPRRELAEVIVVDSGSADGTASVVAAFPEDEVRWLPQGRNCGFGAGNNAGVAALEGDRRFVLFLNPDCRIDRGSLVALLSYLDGHERCAIAAPLLLRSGVELPSAGSIGGLANELRLVVPRLVGRRLPQRRNLPVRQVAGPVGYVEGACMAVRLEALRAAGGFDERYFLFYEELDLARRFAVLGYSVDLVTSAVAEHVQKVSRRSLPFEGRAHLVASAYLYLRKWSGPAKAGAFQVAARAGWAALAATNRLSPPEHRALRASLSAAVELAKTLD